MGMYDYLFIDTNKLPISEQEKEELGSEPGWQTKDFDNLLTEVYITDEGELKINRWEYKNVPLEERPFPDGEGLLSLVGSLQRINERLETVPLTGPVRFYTGGGMEKWYEFVAFFVKGFLLQIEKIETE